MKTIEDALYLGVSSIPVPWDLIAVSVLIFIALPVAAGAISRKIILQKKGEGWFNNTYIPLIGKISIIALLTTLIVLFSFEGEVILNNPSLVAYLAAPNLMHYATMITWTYLLGYFAGWAYETAIDTTLIGSSSHFEVAIAVATTLYGIGSGNSHRTTIGSPIDAFFGQAWFTYKKILPKEETLSHLFHHTYFGVCLA